MVPRVKLAYDKVSPLYLRLLLPPPSFYSLVSLSPPFFILIASFRSPDHPLDDKLMIAESIRHYPPRTSELDCHPGLQEDRRIAR